MRKLYPSIANDVVLRTCENLNIEGGKSFSLKTKQVIMRDLIFILLLFYKVVAHNSRPNIIVIVADDLGWNDLSFHGSSQIPTPNLDFLAENGIILNNYYVCPICSPSRSSLMTGMHPIHTGLQHGSISSSHPWGLPLDRKLMPHIFKEMGYITHAVGKVIRILLLDGLAGSSYLEILNPHFIRIDKPEDNVMPDIRLQHDVIYVDQPWGLPLGFTTLPEHMRKLGYSTHAVGKWHLGFFRKEYTPVHRGFDSHYGYWSGKEDYFDHTQQMGEMWGLDFHHNMSSVRNVLGKYSTSLFSEHAASIITNHNESKPLFLYLAYQAVHSANSYGLLQAPADYIARFPYIKDPQRRIFAGMVSAMDDGINLVIKALQKKRMLKNSIVMFTTDNGGPAAGFNYNAASNWPLRGVKATLWEGGVRGIAFLWSPLLANSGRVSMELMHITDWLPTLYHAAGGDKRSLGKLDGYDMWDTLSMKTPSPRKEVLINIDPINKVSALRVGDYKVIQGTIYGGNWDGWYGPSGRHNHTSQLQEEGEYIFHDDQYASHIYMHKQSSAELTCGPKPENASTNCRPNKKPCLFNVNIDPCEYNNIASEFPLVFTQLLKRLEQYNSTAVPPGNKPADPRSNPKYHNYEWINWMDVV